MPPEISDEIDVRTADEQREAFVLPVKKQVRTQAGVAVGDLRTVTLERADG